jgi:hypothetical protein
MKITPELIFGLIGTLTGTISLLISWRTWLADRSKFRMEASISGAQSIEIPQWHYELKVTLKNHGRRSVKIRELGLILGENEWETINGHQVRLESSRLQPFNFSRHQLEFAEGDRHDFHIEPFDLALVAKARKSSDRSVVVYAIDSLDKEYRAKADIPDEESIKLFENLDRSNASDITEEPNKSRLVNRP